MKHWKFLGCAIVSSSLLLAAGCGKSDEAVPEVPESGSNAEGAALSPQPNQAAPAPPPGDGAARPAAAKPPANQNEQLVGMVHGFMTQQLRIFVNQKGRLPQNFAEFANTRMDSVPRPPDGFHWAIDERTIEVKLVR